MNKKAFALIVGVLCLVGIVSVAYVLLTKFARTNTIISTYEECVKASGSRVQESYPATCITKNGVSFVQPIASIIASPTVGMANPASTFCIENGGTLEIRTKEDGSQYGVCVFDNGKECDEWEFLRGECGK